MGEADICLDPISKFSTRAISVVAAVMSTQVLYMRTKQTEDFREKCGRFPNRSGCVKVAQYVLIKWLMMINNDYRNLLSN